MTLREELDLERGDPSRSSPDSERRRRRRVATEDTPKEGMVDAEVRSRLERTFDRIIKSRRAHDDEELAQVIEEDAEAMTQGFVDVTTHVPFLRGPLLMFLNVLEPVLAFNRTGRILMYRLFTWRQRRAERQHQEENPVMEYRNGVPHDWDGNPIPAEALQ